MPNAKIDFTELNRTDLDVANSQDYAKDFEKGLTEALVREISADKKEPKWLLDIRLKAFKKFQTLH